MYTNDQTIFYQKIFEKFVPNLTIELVEKSQGSKKGDNYTSILDSVVLKGVVKCGEKVEKWQKSVFCKRLPECEARRETYKSEGLFHNEINFYSVIYPEFKKYQEQHGITEKNIFDSLPKCYYAEDNILVLEDLRESGFKMPDRVQGLTLTEIKSVLIELAKFHSLSLSIKSTDPEKFNKLKEQISEGIFRIEYKDWYKSYYAALTSNAVQMIRDGIPENTKYLDEITNFTKSFFDDFTQLVATETPLAVLCHGDCWTNNVLFSYKGCGEIKKTCFIDFQLMRYGSLTLDLVYALYLSLPHKLRKTHKTELVRFYYESLLKQLRLYGPLPKELKSEENLWQLIQNDLQTFSKFALYTGMDMIPILTCDGEEAPDVYEEEEDVPHVTQAPELGIPINDSCRQTMVDLVVELVDEGLL